MTSVSVTDLHGVPDLAGSRPWVAPAWERFAAHRLGLTGAAILAVMAVLAALAPWIAPYSPTAIDIARIGAGPSWAHLLGTDELGRDVLTRVLYGGCVSLPVGVLSTAIAAAIGTTYGAIAGYRGGWLDALMMRGVDFLLAFPTIFVLLILASLRRGSVLAVTLYIGLFGWMGIARLVRGQALHLREHDFVLAARSIGATTRRIIVVHLVPNALGPVVAAATLGVGVAMLVEATLDFLGFGVSPDTPTWGNLLTNAEYSLTTAPLLALAPGLLITVTVTCVSLVGDALRDALDPHHGPRR